MRTAIDAARRIVVPKALRQAARLEPELEVRLVGDHIEIEPTAAPVRLVSRRGITVAEPIGGRERLTQAEVDAVLEQTRADRGGSR